jgi:dihydroorotase
MLKLIANATIINESQITIGHILIKDGKIEDIFSDQINHRSIVHDEYIEAIGKIIIPGVIDDQVHFREPGLTHKGDIYTESKAAVAGGVTSYMEMPNTNPQTISQELLKEKFDLAKAKSLANYSFYIGATNDNIEELIKTDPKNVCGIKVFMGASTGNMLVDNSESLEQIFSKAPLLVAVHCEDELTIKQNSEKFKSQFGEDIPIKYHPLIRSEDACYKSSQLAVNLAKKHNTRLHILHLSTEKELSLFDNQIPLKDKQITSEVCVHHLWFDESDYEQLGTKIKWNPAIKKKSDKEALFKGMLENKLDIIATDHAPHTTEEKNSTYFKAPSGGPLVQHSLLAMLEFYHKGSISLEKIVEKMCHAPSDIFQIDRRGYIRKGYWADLVLIDLHSKNKVEKENIYYKCGWSTFEGLTFESKIYQTYVNGNLVYDNGTFYETNKGKALIFNR